MAVELIRAVAIKPATYEVTYDDTGLGAELSDVLAPLASPALTGVPTAPTAVAGTDTIQVATTAFVMSAVAVVDGGRA